MRTELWLGDLRAMDHLEDLGVCGKTVLNWMFEELDGVTWTRSFWIRIGWRAVVNAVMNFRVT